MQSNINFQAVQNQVDFAEGTRQKMAGLMDSWKSWDEDQVPHVLNRLQYQYSVKTVHKNDLMVPHEITMTIKYPTEKCLNDITNIEVGIP